MIAAQCLGVSATACQGLYVFEFPFDKSIKPLAMYLTTLGASGERKSATNSLISEPIPKFEKKISKAHQARMSQYVYDMSIWQLKQDVLKKEFQKAIRAGKDTKEIEGRLNIHSCLEPKKPKGVRIIYQDVNPASLKLGMRDNHPFAFIMMDEAGDFFVSAMVNDFKHLNGFSGGSDLIVDRVSTGNFIVEFPVLSIAIMLQPEIFAEALMKKMNAMRYSGLLSRMFICFPDSTQGYRTNTVENPDMQGLERFHARITALLERTFIDEGATMAERQVLTFDERAKQVLKVIDQQIETEQLPGGRFCDMQDFASKMLEHTCRLAAIFHVMDDRPGLEIGEGDVQRAYAIVDWYAVQFYNLVVLQMAPTQDQRDAETLLAWMQKYEQTNGSVYCTKGFIGKNVTNQLREPSRLAKALSILVDQRLVEEHQYDPRMYPTHPHAPKARRGTYYRLVNQDDFARQNILNDYYSLNQNLSPLLNQVVQ